MHKPAYPNLFKPLNLNGLRLKNRITMAPLYLGYAAEGGRMSRLLLYHYREMARSGAAMIMVENASITAGGSGSPRTIRCDHDRYLKGLETLADTIHKEKSIAGLQINHAGRFAHVSEPVAPSAVPTFGRNPRALTKREITTIQKQYAKAALRVKKAGFDLVELHGGTGYLLAQFVSPRTNRRSDAYGGAIENRIKFPLEVLKRVKDTVGDFPVGYRFLVNEWLADGLNESESIILAKHLEQQGIAYISAMGGTYESFFLPEIVKKSKRVGYMVSLAAAVKKTVNIPVIAAGRISTPLKAESILKEKKADLIGLARMLWVDPEWPRKARKGEDRSILKCSPKCDACFQLVMKGKPAYCPRWGKQRRALYQGLFQ
ncbi:MAG: NADH:flavin oxidoreductase [Deltaproteobacteria bacterium]|jgi:2,4-dienoyl-CoA reductase (NADPH2)|nr:NADH:flavin oxidoreductase [Deltaproteobacteria bacterium]MBW2489157.1 NADH:flavin oxidoreductase [Deltaproteobacteria bacterium]MBW2517646.1 NADH:flavin oxidoreductase [Deltaproteobacteria bacterium]